MLWGCHCISLHIPWPTPEVSILFLVVCSISVVCEVGRRGTCGVGRLLVGLVHFTVDMIPLRCMGTFGQGRWLATTAAFGWLGGCKHWEAGTWVHTAICGTNKAWFSLLVWGLSKCVCIGFGVLEHSVPVIDCSPFTSQLAVWLKIVPSPCMLPMRWCLIVPTYVSPCQGVSLWQLSKGWSSMLGFTQVTIPCVGLETSFEWINPWYLGSSSVPWTT